MPLASADAATTTRWPARSSAQSRCARGEAPATRAATPASVARPPLAGQVFAATHIGSPGPGGVGAGCGCRSRRDPLHEPGTDGCGGQRGAGAETTERRRTWRWRSPTSATASGGSVWSASSLSRASSRSRSRAHSAGSQPAAARAAVCASRRRPRTARSASSTVAGRHADQVGDPAGVDSPDRVGCERRPLERVGAAHHGEQGGQHGVVRLGRGIGGGGRANRIARRRGGAVPGRGEGRGQHAPAGGGTGGALVEQLAPLPVQVGQGLGRDPAGGRCVEGDQARHRLELPPARDHEVAEVLLGGDGHDGIRSPGHRSSRLAPAGERRRRAGARRRPTAPAGSRSRHRG